MTRDLVILAEIIRRLRATGVVDDRVFECRGDSLASGALPAIDVMPQSAASSEIGATGSRLGYLGAVRHELQVTVTIYVREGVDTPPTQVADPVVAAAHAAVMADMTLGGLAARVQLTQRRWNPAVADGTFLSVELIYTVVHATKTDDFTVGV